MTQTFASGLQPVQIPHQDHHSFSGSASTTPTFTPANKPTPLVGRWADYGWDRTTGEPTSATLPTDHHERESKVVGTTPLLPSTVSAFDDRQSPLAAKAEGAGEYLSNLLSETAKLDDEDCPAPRAATPPPAAFPVTTLQPAPQAEVPRTSTYGRQFQPQRQVQVPPETYQVTGYVQPKRSFAAPPTPYDMGYWVPPPAPPPPAFGGHMMPTLHVGGPHTQTVSKFTPPPPPTVVFAAELGGTDSDTPAHEVGAILFHQGQRWVQKMSIWLAAHPRERPSAPCPAPEHYTTIEAWLEKLGAWYQANFHSRKAARPTRGGRGAPANGSRGGGRARGDVPEQQLVPDAFAPQ